MKKFTKSNQKNLVPGKFTFAVFILNLFCNLLFEVKVEKAGFPQKIKTLTWS